jgi:hypothetical protein
MKVLLLGMNYASTINSTIIGLKQQGIEAESISFEIYRSQYNNFSEIDCVFENGKKKFSKLEFLKSILKLINKIKTSDVVHVYSDFKTPSRFHKQIEYFLFKVIGKNKKKFITFVGSEVRIPEIENTSNPFFKSAYDNPNYEYKDIESETQSKKIQKRFNKLGFKLICPPDIIKFIDINLYHKNHIVLHPAIVSKNSLNKSEINQLIHFVHAPSAPIAKGTEYILKTVEKLKENNFKFKFSLLSGLSNEEYLEELSNSDIYIDQLIWGWYGVAAIQALGMKKPVIAYLDESLLDYTPNNPIINSTIDNLYEIMSELILNPEKVNILKNESEQFYLNNHHPKSVANNLYSIYNSK